MAPETLTQIGIRTPRNIYGAPYVGRSRAPRDRPSACRSLRCATTAMTAAPPERPSHVVGSPSGDGTDAASRSDAAAARGGATYSGAVMKEEGEPPPSPLPLRPTAVSRNMKRNPPLASTENERIGRSQFSGRAIATWPRLTVRGEQRQRR